MVLQTNQKDNCDNYSIHFIKGKFAAKDPKFASIYEKCSQTYPLDIEKLCEEIGLTIEYHDDLDQGASGSFDGEKAIIVNAKHSITRQRFTLAHELGHYLLHEGKNNREQSYVYTGIQQTYEREANLFARSILMPWEKIDETINIFLKEEKADNLFLQLASLFQVSSEALKVRLITLGLIQGW